LYIQPLKVIIQFLLSNRRKESQISIILGVPSRILSNVHDAPIRLNGLYIQEHLFNTKKLIHELKLHYIPQLYNQIFLIIGSFESFGSPVVFFSTVGSGIIDLIQEPAKGLKQGRRKFMKGIRIGGE